MGIKIMVKDVPFSKMNGLGNNIIVADMRGRTDGISLEAMKTLVAIEEISFDQIMEIRDSSRQEVDARLRILNSNGSEAGACGNGVRCVVLWLGNNRKKEHFLFETQGGLLSAGFSNNGMISVDMGKPKFDWQEIPLAESFFDTAKIELQAGPIDAPILHSPSVVNMGNPHCIFWVEDDVGLYDLERFGPLFENHPVFPEQANISIARIISGNRIVLKTWERGAGLTLACGSAACAALVNGVRKKYTDRKAIVTMPGGDLTIEWLGNNRVLMTGPAELEFSGWLDARSGDCHIDRTQEYHE